MRLFELLNVTQIRLEEQTMDSELWTRFLAGDNYAYQSIYEKYASNLFSMGLKYSRDEELVKDHIHDLFVHIYSSRNKLTSVSNIKLYLFVSLKNSLYNSYKKGNRNILFPQIENIEDETTIVKENAESKLIEKENISEQKELIGRGLALLTERQKEIIHYRFYESLSINEISVLMDINYQSVQNILQRSIKKLKDTFVK